MNSPIDAKEIWARLKRGTTQIIGLVALCSALSAGGYLLTSWAEPVTTKTRVAFAFPGFEKGEYPDHSKFHPDDIRAPDVIVEALRRVQLDSSPENEAKIRGAIGIEPVIPPNIVKERDRLRASGQAVPIYNPDEYFVSLTLARGYHLSSEARERVLREIISVYRERFQHTYADVPLSFGSAFATLRNADFPEYELILNQEVQSIIAYLTQELDKAKSFRSRRTNYSFKDLIEQTQLFAQLRMNETLGVIRENGLSRNRHLAMVKLDYYLRTLEQQEHRAKEEDAVVRELLTQAQNRDRDYVLGIKNQGVQSKQDGPLIDQGLIDSLLANDAYSFLVHKALDSGLLVKRIESDKSDLVSLRESMKTFITNDVSDQSNALAQAQKSLENLEAAYNQLMANIRETYSDYSLQQFSRAIRTTDQIQTTSLLKETVIALLIGAVIGFLAGTGLSLIDVSLGTRRTDQTT